MLKQNTAKQVLIDGITITNAINPASKDIPSVTCYDSFPSSQFLKWH